MNKEALQDALDAIQHALIAANEVIEDDEDDDADSVDITDRELLSIVAALNETYGPKAARRLMKFFDAETTDDLYGTERVTLARVAVLFLEDAGVLE